MKYVEEWKIQNRKRRSEEDRGGKCWNTERKEQWLWWMGRRKKMKESRKGRKKSHIGIIKYLSLGRNVWVRYLMSNSLEGGDVCAYIFITSEKDPCKKRRTIAVPWERQGGEAIKDHGDWKYHCHHPCFGCQKTSWLPWLARMNKHWRRGSLSPPSITISLARRDWWNMVKKESRKS